MSSNFEGGVTNVKESYPFFGNFLRPVPVGLTYGYWDDLANVQTSTNWTLTQAGTNTLAITDAVGGVQLVTLDVNDNDHVYAQMIGESFILAAQKPLWFSTRLAINEVIQSDWFAGLYVTDTDPVGGITDGVYFTKADGAATVNAVSVVGSSATTLSSIKTLVNATQTVFEFYWNGVDFLDFFVDGSPVGHIAGSARPTTEMRLSWAFQTGEATNVKTLSMDWIGAELVR
jgi:hypothetical protein